MRTKRERADFSVAWIGYTDFLMSVAVLFFLMWLGSSDRAAAVVVGQVVATRPAVGGGAFRVVIQGLVDKTCESDGRFHFTVEGIANRMPVPLQIFYRGAVVMDTTVTIAPGESTAVRISTWSRDTRIRTLSASALFRTGQWDLTAEGQDSLRALANDYRPQLTGARMLYICGHTDKQAWSGGPIDNWDLSTFRAMAAARFIMREGGIEQRRIVVAGLGEWHPLPDSAPSGAPAKKAEQLARNRRIEFRLLESGEDLGARLDSSTIEATPGPAD